MGSIIVAMPKLEDAKHIASILRRYGNYEDIVLCSSSSAILREANERESGVIICRKAVKGMEYMELADYMPPRFGMIVLTHDTSLELYTDRMLRLVLPLKVKDLMATVATVLSGFDVVKRPKKKIQVKRDPEEQKLIDEAKQILMEKKDMTEPEAFRYIQKNAMDASRTLVESAQLILLLNSDWSN